MLSCDMGFRSTTNIKMGTTGQELIKLFQTVRKNTGRNYGVV
jgi:hypothetical protein